MNEGNSWKGKWCLLLDANTPLVSILKDNKCGGIFSKRKKRFPTHYMCFQRVWNIHEHVSFWYHQIFYMLCHIVMHKCRACISALWLSPAGPFLKKTHAKKISLPGIIIILSFAKSMPFSFHFSSFSPGQVPLPLSHSHFLQYSFILGAYQYAHTLGKNIISIWSKHRRHYYFSLVMIHSRWNLLLLILSLQVLH